MRHRILRYVPALLLLAVLSASGQGTTVVQRENVSYEYAKVMRVTPVYQTLNATRIEQQCDGAEARGADGSRLSKVVGAVRGAFKREGGARPESTNCRSVPVQRQFRRPVAYDVDYTYRGGKYRSRLGSDPGHLLRIRVSVMPMP